MSKYLTTNEFRAVTVIPGSMVPETSIGYPNGCIIGKMKDDLTPIKICLNPIVISNSD